MSPLRKTANSTRIDLRIPDNLLDKIRELAIENNAPIHHKSHKPELTSTIIELIEKALSGNTSDSLSDNYHDGTIESLKGEFEAAIAEIRTLLEYLEKSSFVSSTEHETSEPTQPTEILSIVDVETVDDTAIAVSTIPVDNLAITPEKTIDNAPKTDETNNQDETPITDTESVKGLSTNQLAKDLGMGKTTLNDLKRDLLAGKEVSLDRLKKIEGWEPRKENGRWYKK